VSALQKSGSPIPQSVSKLFAIHLDIILPLEAVNVKFKRSFHSLIFFNKAYPKTCATCTDAGTCQTCSAGNYFANSFCIPCPEGTFLDSPTSCAGILSNFLNYSSGLSLACPIHCSSCDDAQTCTSCDTGYGLYNDACILCPAETYLNNKGVCKSKFLSKFSSSHRLSQRFLKRFKTL